MDRGKSRLLLGGRAWPVGLALGALLLFLVRTFRKAAHGALLIEDDAKYYAVVANHIVALGKSTFDQQTLTNGYHPLWLGVLVIQHIVMGPSVLATTLIEIACLAGALLLMLRSARPDAGLWQAGFAVVFVAVIGHIALTGMEVALTMLCIGLLIASLDWARGGEARRGLVVGLAAALSIGARIDSAFFVVPLLIFAPLGPGARRRAFLVLAGLGGLYAAANLAIFGAMTPVSSAIKSLGGLQLNLRLLSQLGVGPDARPVDPLFVATTLFLLASPVLAPLTRHGSRARAWALATSIGGYVYLGKLLLLSSWMVWPWYSYAILFPMLTVLYGGADALSALRQRWPRLGASAGLNRLIVRAAGGAILVAGLAVTALYLRTPKPNENNFDTINHLALQRYGAVLAGQPVAMGDRAGSLAMEYPGPVVQLEGLVNDVTYFRTLKSGGDLHDLLCRRQVRFIFSYEQDLGAYDHFQIPVLRPFLTQYRSPEISVRRADEVGHVQDLRLYDNRRDHESGNNTLYLWRLRCA